MILSSVLFADCTARQKSEAEMIWKQSIHQDSTPKRKLKTLSSAYQKCALEKIAIDKYIAYVYTLSPKERKNQEIVDTLYKIEKKNQELSTSVEHRGNNQRKINFLLGKEIDGTLKAVEEVNGVYNADIRFDYDSAKLKNIPLVKEIIQKIASEISKKPNAIFGLEGGASSKGKADYNKKLSKRRAESLKNAILKQYPNFEDNIRVYGNGENGLVCEGGFVPEIDENTGEGRCITKEDKEASQRVTIRREQ